VSAVQQFDPVVEAVARQCSQLCDRLRQARITATSPQAIVTVVYNGFADGVEMRLKPGARRRFDASGVAASMTAALMAADRAADALHQHAHDEVRLGDDTRGGWRNNPDSAAATVAACFGTPAPTRGTT
jgi:DNA-binding protein YbaB